MSPSGLWRRVALVRPHISQKLIASIIRLERTGDLGTTLLVTIYQLLFTSWKLLLTFLLTDSFQRNYGGHTFLRNVNSNKSPRVPHLRTRHSQYLPLQNRKSYNLRQNHGIIVSNESRVKLGESLSLQHSDPPTFHLLLPITINLLDFVHRPDFYKQKTQRFGNWICFRLQARGGAPTPMDSSCGQVFIVPLFPVVDLLLFWHRLWKGKLLVFL
jgi:hypothetical protein